MKFGIIANIHKKLFWEHFPQFLKWFEENKVEIVLSRRIVEHSPYSLKNYDTENEEAIPKNCDLILAFGGDGTILHTVRLVGPVGTPILGINVGGLGFLTEIPLEQFGPIFEEILKGKYRIEERLILQGEIKGDSKPLYALNDLVIDKGNSSRVIQIQIEINSKYLNAYIADGLILSTPTGSTGYSLSSGGPIVVPSTSVLCINPICPHSLTNRPVIIPDDSRIKATVFTEYKELMVVADGRDIRFCKSGTEIAIGKAPFRARLIKHKHSDFFALLRSKLHWGEDFRNKSRWSYQS